jgi:ComF family protein
MVYGRAWSGGLGRYRCALCGQRADDLGLCPGCVADLPWQGPACRRCAVPLATGEVCGSCLETPPPYDEAVAIFNYAEPADSMIQRLKFGGDLAYARTLGKLMAIELVRRAIHHPRMIIPVPLHPGRLIARGFNQAVELARPLADRIGIPLDRTVCVRMRATAEQSGLDAAGRHRNVKNAFRVIHPVAGADVAVVDDVMTTGSTLEAVAQALKRAGARRVSVWVCARAAPPHR